MNDDETPSDDGGAAADDEGPSDADPTLDAAALDEALDAAFPGGPNERRAVVRAAVDLADDGRLVRDRGTELAIEMVVEELRDAPDDSVADRWNWWLGALEIAYGGYEPFQVRRYAAEDRE